jgi:rhodanese-related sulfurtransferase
VCDRVQPLPPFDVSNRQSSRSSLLTGDYPLVLDVREPGEVQKTGRIPGAINIPVTTAPDSYHIPDEEFNDRFGFDRPSKDAEVVFYCKAGVRSRAAAALAKDAGFVNVGEYPGSWVDWEKNNGVTER